MEEITVNLHNHSVNSDGTGNLYEIAQAGISAGLDALVVTDHNLYVQGGDAYYYRDGKKLLLLMGEEIHDPQGAPGNHLLVLNHKKELSSFAGNMQSVIDAVNLDGGITILAHPFDKAIGFLKMNAYPWTNWEAREFTGLELINYLCEFKAKSGNVFSLLYNLIFPHQFLDGANADTIRKWDELLIEGRRISAYAGSDAHQLKFKFGPFAATIFSYLEHFRNLNNHVFIEQPLSGDPSADRQLIFNALRSGRSYVAADLFHPAKGFVFKIDHENGTAYPGEQVRLGNSATLKILIPAKATSRLIHNGKVFQQWEGNQSIPVTVTEPGYYRVECYLPYQGKLRGWIYANPIYLFRR